MNVLYTKKTFSILGERILYKFNASSEALNTCLSLEDTSCGKKGMSWIVLDTFKFFWIKRFGV